MEFTVALGDGFLGEQMTGQGLQFVYLLEVNPSLGMTLLCGGESSIVWFLS